MNFPHPQMQSFNYDEQANQQLQQQQQALFDRNYVPESAISDYNLDSAESSSDAQNDVHEELPYPTSEIEQLGNNIEPEKIHRETPIATYFNKADDNNGISTNFYTVLPSKEAAEKLAVLAAAGNINSYLIEQLRKQQQEKDAQRNNQMPFNHKNDENDDNGESDGDNDGDDNDDNDNDNINDQQIKNDQQWKYDLRKIQHDHQNQSYEIQQDNEKLPLQITVSDKETHVTSNDTMQMAGRDTEVEYEYEYESEENGENKDGSYVASLSDGKTFSHANSHKEFGARLRSKN